MTVTSDERRELSGLFTELGPDAPTLCGTWTTRDLLAHLLVRERRLDAAGGIVVPALAGRTQRAMDGFAGQPFDHLVELFRNGPPLWSPWSLPWIGDKANLFEFYVHHEDVRRAQPEWAPRPDDPQREDALWGSLKLAARMLYRRSPVGVVLRSAGRGELVVRKGARSVAVVGLPSEITLNAYGRPDELIRVVVEGDHDDIVAFANSARGL